MSDQVKTLGLYLLNAFDEWNTVNQEILACRKY